MPQKPIQEYLIGGKRIKKQHTKIATMLAFLIIPMSGLITDMYIPSMPHMGISLHQSESAIQFTLTLFLISYGIAQFITGSLIDAFGRYRLTLFSLVVFIISNIIIVMTNSIGVIYLMRVVQGVSTGFIVVSKRAFFVDMFEGDKRKNYLSLMSIVWSAAPVVAPFLGGYLEHLFNWQANFYVLAIYGIIILVLEIFFSGETLPEVRSLHVQSIIKDYKVMMQDPLFFNGLLISGLCYGTTMVFSLSGAFIIEHNLHFTPVVAGYAALGMGIAWMCGGFIGKATIQKSFLPKLRLVNVFQIFITILMIGLGIFMNNIYSLVIFAFCVHICVGFIFNNYFAFCLGRFPNMAGVVSGLCGGSTMVITAISSYMVVGFLHPHSQQSLGNGYLIMGIAAFIILQFLLAPFVSKLNKLNVTKD